mmetsp:Transcript_91308/g.258619  ORF Transcript_91308/g.258619 Transcript_91308/m.258619 type:complete len:1051 (+) Transcript_91308:350-3502(+)
MCPVGPIAVIQRLHGDAKLPLAVALAVELLHDERGPGLAEPEGLRGVGDVAEVEQRDAQVPAHVRAAEEVDDLPRRELDAAGPVHLLSGVEELGVDLVERLELLDHGEVVLVVGVEHGLDADPPGFGVLGPRELAEDGRLGLARELEEPRAVHALERRLVVVAQRELVRGLHEEGVAEARVPDVVADSAHEEREALQGPQVVLRARELEGAEEGEGHVHGVGPAVVGHLLGAAVAPAGGLEEARAALGPLLARGPAEHGAVVEAEAREADREPGLLVELAHVQVPGVEVLRTQARVQQQLLHELRQALAQVWAGHVLVLVLRQGPAVALQQRAVALAQAAEGLRVQGRGLRRDLAQHCELPQHLLQQLRLRAETALVLVHLVALVLVLLALGHGGHGGEDFRGDLLDIAQEHLQRHEHNRRDGVHEHQAGGHHEHHDRRDEQAVAQRVHLVGAFEAEAQVRAALGRPNLNAVALPCRHGPREAHQRAGAVRELHGRLEGVVALVQVEELEVPQDLAQELGRLQRLLAQPVGPDPHREVGLRVGQKLEERQQHDHDNDEARDARREGHVELPGDDLGGAGAALLLEAGQEAQQLHELREAASPGAELRHAGGAHDDSVVQALGHERGHERVVQRHRDDAHEVHPEEEGAGVGAGQADGLHRELREEGQQDRHEEHVQHGVAADIHQDPEVGQEERQQEAGKHQRLEGPRAVAAPAERAQRLQAPLPGVGLLLGLQGLLELQREPELAARGVAAPQRALGLLLVLAPLLLERPQVRVLLSLQVPDEVPQQRRDLLVPPRQGQVHDGLAVPVAREGVRLGPHELLYELARSQLHGLVQALRLGAALEERAHDAALQLLRGPDDGPQVAALVEVAVRPGEQLHALHRELLRGARAEHGAAARAPAVVVQRRGVGPGREQQLHGARVLREAGAAQGRGAQGAAHVQVRAPRDHLGHDPRAVGHLGLQREDVQQRHELVVALGPHGRVHRGARVDQAPHQAEVAPQRGLLQVVVRHPHQGRARVVRAADREPGAAALGLGQGQRRRMPPRGLCLRR